jgi:hypothetical protein
VKASSRVLTYLCCCAGYTRQEADRLASQLHADGAVISTSLPDHTWLLLVLPEALKPDAYQPHTLVSVIIMINVCLYMQQQSAHPSGFIQAVPLLLWDPGCC